MGKLFVPFILLAALLFLFCEKDAESLYNKDKKFIDRPVITGVTPNGEALAGIQEITIDGQYFSSVISENQVYFNGKRGTVLSASSSSLVVLTPNLIADSVILRVASAGALDFSDPIHYKLNPAVYDILTLTEDDSPEFLACDKNSNLYVLDNKTVYKITPAGEKTEFGSVSFSICTECKVGPEGYVYFARKNNKIYRISPSGGEAEEWASASERVYAFDFDQNGNCVTAGKSDLIISVDKNGNSTEIGQLPGYQVASMRIFNNQLYVLANDNETNQQVLLKGSYSNGSVGTMEIYIDWHGLMPEDVLMNEFTISADGQIYIASNHEKGILIFSSNTEWQPLYEGLIHPDVIEIVWGPGINAFIISNQEDGYHLINVNMLKDGAPYFGRQ